MKVRDILGAGLERRFRGPRKPRNKQVGFHQKMKKLLDKALKEEGARIQHLEDLIIWDGSVGGQKAITKLHQVETSPKSISIKWDGSPAVIFGRNENGEFVLTDKSGFTAKGYNGKVTSGDDLDQMFLNRAKGEIEDSRREFASKMKNILNTVAVSYTHLTLPTILLV